MDVVLDAGLTLTVFQGGVKLMVATMFMTFQCMRLGLILKPDSGQYIQIRA
jgi:hypothetical protein